MPEIMQKLLNEVLMTSVDSRGWLLEDFRLFHSLDQRDMDFQTHFHDFHKIVVCMSGIVTYFVEGNTYELTSGDILIIPEHQIHRSVLHSAQVYERMILWISDSFIRRCQADVLRSIFAPGAHFLHITGQDWVTAVDRLKNLESCQTASYPGHNLMCSTYLIQFLVSLLSQLTHTKEMPAKQSGSNLRMNEVICFISENLQEDLSVDTLANRFYLSSSYLMHAFKRHTGCTLHQYILQKRLIASTALIRKGESIADAAHRSGFSDYSVFLKAFRKQYGCAPREMRFAEKD